MQQLTNAEEQLMEHLWKLEKAFMKDLQNHFQNQDHYRGHFTET
jgi:predicted transcriptional regulator